ncbi:hypothetical protein LTR86_002518 [Recurvomyces mirabilis]|nr:hypothetical protein LTR86_002518 [Recurvomyces mirabilis]
MPGAGKQPPEVQARIRELLEAGFDPTTIHRKLKVGRSSIYRMKRSLQQHGTTYMPIEMNKKNGRPKVLTAEQELEVRDWLRDPKNRNRYLDDLVWLTHDRFNIVCSTTTMSKLKRKWLKVIECEENGQPLDDATRVLVMETHPTLPIIQQGLDSMPAPITQLQLPQPAPMRQPRPPKPPKAKQPTYQQNIVDHPQYTEPEPPIDARLLLHQQQLPESPYYSAPPYPLPPHL